MPNNQVANAGVRCLGSTSPNLGGNARCIAIDSAVRAAGRIVVWQLAADELSTAMISSLSATSPKPDDAEHEVAGRRRARRRSCSVRKSAPFTACAANATIT